MELLTYMRVLRQRLWMVGAGPLVAALAAAAISLLLPPVYEANVSLLVRPSQPLSSVDSGVAALTSDQISRTYAQLMTERPLLQTVIADAGLRTRPEDLQKHIRITPQPNTTIIDVAVDSTDATQARDIANILVRDFVQQIKSIQQQETQAPNARSADNLIVVAPAVLPDRPASPNKLLATVGGAVGGLLLAICLIFLVEYLDQSVKSDEDLVERVGLVPVGHVPMTTASSGRRGELVTLNHNGPAAEAYRAIRTNLMFAGLERDISTVVITSASPGEGKSRTAANLAIVLAEAGHRTVLVDADFRRPSQHRFFGVVRNVGLANLLLQDHPESELVRQPDGIPNLWLITSGPTPANPSELLGSTRMKESLARLKGSFRYVVIDTPPVNAVTDAAILAADADATLLIVEEGKTTVPSLRRAKQALDRVGARLAGPIVNKMRRDALSFSYYNYAYGSAPARAPKSSSTLSDAESPSAAPRPN
jgi:receptor protein-tyrosine kinase